MYLFGGAGLFHLQALLERMQKLNEKEIKKIFLIEPISEIREDFLFLEKFNNLAEHFSMIQIQLTLLDLNLKNIENDFDANFNSHSIELDSKQNSTSFQQFQIQFQNTLQGNSNYKMELFFHPFYRRYFPIICSSMKEGLTQLRQETIQSKTNSPLDLQDNDLSQSNSQSISHSKNSEDSHFGSSSQNINESTISHFARTWTSHFFRNKLELTSLKILTPNTKYLDYPLVFAGASPLLDGQIDWINRNRSRMFLLSSDTALGFLIQKNTIPDAVISVDSSRGTFFHFSKNLPTSIPIFTWLGGNRILFNKKMNTYLFLTSYPLDQLLAEVCHFPDSSILSNPSRNVAGMAISIARYQKYKTIYLAGFELKSDISKTHVQSTGYESYGLPLVHRKKGLDSFYPRKMYSSQFTKKNFNSFQAIAETKGIDCQILSNSSPDLTCPELKNSQEINFLEIPSTVSLHLDQLIHQKLPGVVPSVLAKYQQL